MDAEDIDALLDEVEKDLNKPNKPKIPGSKAAQGRTRISTTEDLDNLLTDLPHSDHQAADGTRYSSVPESQDKKCWPPYLNGSCDSASVRSCTHLRCVKCDSSVVSFDGWQWSSDVTYLFLRTNYPSIDKLRAKLQPRRRCRAYACQCTSAATSEPVALTARSDLNWICAAKATT